MIKAILGVALLVLSGCDLAEKVPAPLAHAVGVRPLPTEAATRPDHGLPKRGPSPASVTPSDPTAAILDAIGEAKGTVERRSYILDDRANQEMP